MKTAIHVLQRHNAEIVPLEYGRDNDRLGLNIPLFSPDTFNERVQPEIIEQVDRLRQIIYKNQDKEKLYNTR
jgi:hypothetical protein